MREFGAGLGYARPEMGVGESVRCAARAAKEVGIEFSVRSVDGCRPNGLNDRSIATTDGEPECPFGLNVIHVNDDQTPDILEKLPDSPKSEHYNIGYCAWELERFPERWHRSFGYADEVAAPREKSPERSSRSGLLSFVPS